MSRPTLHLVPEAVWVAHDPGVPYAPAAFADEGFIHCTDGDEEMLRTANRHYRAVPGPFLVLTVDLDRTGSPWRFDDPAKPYPHVYGPIDPASVTEVRRFRRDADGTFVAIDPG
jgi:uncharacterized protein (DUF952 family)